MNFKEIRHEGVDSTNVVQNRKVEVSCCDDNKPSDLIKRFKQTKCNS
jgi:hypothetical protein